jgi:hypothetical protein
VAALLGMPEGGIMMPEAQIDHAKVLELLDDLVNQIDAYATNFDCFRCPCCFANMGRLNSNLAEKEHGPDCAWQAAHQYVEGLSQ